jgi:hypothetical protein
MITAIIPAMNRKEELERCLEVIADLDVEVIVVTAAPDDARMVKDRYPAVRLIANSHNEALSGQNRGRGGGGEIAVSRLHPSQREGGAVEWSCCPASP